MEQTIRPAEMKELEQRFMRERGIPGLLLMEKAAQGVCAAVSRLAPAGGTALFLCGCGNNGGDGWAAARLWQEAGGRSLVLPLAGRRTPDAEVNRRLAGEAGVTVLPEAEDDDGAALPACDILVDALFGTGLSRAPEGAALSLIRRINASGLPVVAVDVPSGLDADTGEVYGEAVRATETVTFHRVKQGLMLRKGCVFAGQVTRWPILIPAGEGEIPGMEMLWPEELPSLIAKRAPDAHKGTFGRTVLFAGSEGMAGAAVMAAAACVKAGAGLTTVLCRRALLPILQTRVPGAMCRVLPEENGRLTEAAADVAREELRRADRAVIGCGLGLSEDLLPMLRVFRDAACPVVWDADALTLLSRERSLLPLPDKDVLTPHPGEAARLLGCGAEEITADPLRALSELRRTAGGCVVLKEPRTLMTDGVRTAVNPVGTAAMAKGGSGDVLAGILGAMLGRAASDSLLTRVQAAVLVHALAGISAAKNLGENCVTPEDLIGQIAY